MKEPRIHAAAGRLDHHGRLTRGRAICGLVARHVVDSDDEVTCLLCLFWLGRYVPLTHLREHQRAHQMRGAA